MARWVLFSALLVVAAAVRSTPQMAQSVLGEGTQAKPDEDDNPESAWRKLAEIWASILVDDNEPGPAPWAIAPLKLMSALGDTPIIGHVLKYFFEDLRTTFTWRQDIGMPPGHIKAIHPIGSVAQVKLVWDQEAVTAAGYTGLFKTTQENALIRIGPAGAPKDDGMAPGAAIKVFRDNLESVNTFMLYSLRGQKGFNQFEHMMCNKLSDFTDKGFAEKILLDSFRKASKYPFTTGLSQWAEEKGLFPEETKFPFVLCLRPIDAIREKFAEFKTKKPGHIQEQLGLLNAKTNLYDIYAAAEPKQNLTKIGVVSMRTKFRKTKFGDTKLFFRHDKFENDLMVREDWKPIVDEESFWVEEGANNRYSDVDPGEKDNGLEQNAWIGGYNPGSVNEMINDAKEGEGSLLQTGSRPRCPFAYLHQGDSSIVHSLLSR